MEEVKLVDNEKYLHVIKRLRERFYAILDLSLTLSQRTTLGPEADALNKQLAVIHNCCDFLYFHMNKIIDFTSIDLCKDQNIQRYFSEEESILSKIELIKKELYE